MTLLVGMNRQQYVLLAADTMRSFYVSEDKWIHLEDTHKIVLTGIGLFTASGFISAIDSVQEEISNSAISNTDQIREIVKNNVKQEIDELLMQHDELNYYPDFMFTYNTLNQNIPILRLGTIQSKHDYNIAIALNNSGLVSYPSDFFEKDVTTYENELNNFLTIIDETSIIDNNDYMAKLIENIFHNIIVTAKFFKLISSESKFVSSEMDYCAHLLIGGYIYGHGTLEDIIEGNFEYKFLQLHEPCTLTPDLFDEV